MRTIWIVSLLLLLFATAAQAQGTYITATYHPADLDDVAYNQPTTIWFQVLCTVKYYDYQGIELTDYRLQHTCMTSPRGPSSGHVYFDSWDYAFDNKPTNMELTIVITYRMIVGGVQTFISNAFTATYP